MWEAMTYHASSIEIIQMCVAAIGVGISCWAVLDAIKDSMALSLSGINGARRMIADSNIASETERLVVQMGFLCIGLTSVILPPPPAGPHSMLPYEAMQLNIVRWILTTLTIVKAAAGLYQRRERQRFVRHMQWAHIRTERTTTTMKAGSSKE